MHTAKISADAKLSDLTLEQLKDCWRATEKNKSPEIPTVREWIMDEFEKRDENGFLSFLESNNLDEIRAEIGVAI